MRIPPVETTTSELKSEVLRDSQTGQRIWTAGTLRYTKAGLVILFFWLIWNDFFLMLMEAVKPALTSLLLKDHGATNTQLTLIGTVSTVFTIWINPFVSTWSDRTRTPIGRRRPFLLFATPPAAVALAAIPWAPEGWHWLFTIPWFATHFGHGSINGAVLAISICGIVFGIFNSVLMAIFQYYFWDVVPEAMLGRFNAIAKIVTTIKTFIWNYWIFGLAEHYMKWIYGIIAVLFLLIYTVSVLAVKEGGYPPPDSHKKGGKLFAPIRAYVLECYSNPYYLWVFAGFVFHQLGNTSNMFRLFHWRETLGLDLDTIGKMQAWPALGIVLVAYPIGAMLDKLGPMRMMAPSLLLWATINIASYFYLKGAVSLLICFSGITLANFVNGLCSNVLTAEVFPREKLGQFCSANQLVHSSIIFFAAPLIGLWFDHVKDYTCGYALSAFFQILSAAVFVKVYFNWRQAKHHPPLPHAG